MRNKITEMILGKSLLALKKNDTGMTMKRKECQGIVSRAIRFDKDFSKQILKELKRRGLIENHNKGIRVNK